MKTGVYPGTFDPITYGHLDIIKRSLKIVDKLIIGVTTKSSKQTLFSLEERVNLVKASTKNLNIEVKSFTSLTTDFVKKQKSNIIIRGLRELSDFEHEFQQASMNRQLDPKIETILIPTDQKFFYLSSSIVKELASMKAPLSNFVPKPVEKALKEKFK